MKLRNFVIVLLALLMALAVVSCKQNPEPGPQPEPSDATIYVLTATKGRSNGWFSADKFRLDFTSDLDAKVEPGDVFSIKFRSTTEFYEFNVRNSAGKWVYESDKSKLTSFSDPDEYGWITVTYEFADKYYDGTNVGDKPVEFIFDFIGDIVPDDILEVKELTLNGVELELTEAEVAGYVSPSFEETKDATWKVDEEYAVFYFEGDPNPEGSTARNPKYEVVKAGQTMTMNLEKEGFTLKMYDAGPDSSYRKFDFDNPPEESLITKETPITRNTKVSLIYTPNT